MAPESNRLGPGLNPPAAFAVRGDVVLCGNQEQDAGHVELHILYGIFCLIKPAL